MKGQSLRLYVHCRLKSDYFPHLLWLRIWSFHFWTHKHSIWFSSCIDTQYIRYMPQILTKTEMQKIKFDSSSELYILLRNKMRFTLSWPRIGFHRSVTVRMPTWSMVHETASFYWHGIQSDPPGYMSLALQWGPSHYRAHRTCPHLTTQSLLMVSPLAPNPT